MGRIYAQKPKTQDPRHDSSMKEQEQRGQTTPRRSVLDLQRAAGNQAVDRSLDADRATPPAPGLENLTVSQPGSRQEQEANKAEHGAPGAQRAASTPSRGQQSPLRALLGGGKPLSEAQSTAFQTHWGGAPDDIRVHTGQGATDLADRFDAQAFTLGSDIVLGEGPAANHSPGSSGLLAHELTHVAQQQGVTGASASPTTIYRKTKGEEMVDKADTWLTTNDRLKVEVDVLKAALREVKREKSVGFNKTAGLTRVDNAAGILGLNAPAKSGLRSDWEWLVDNRKDKAAATYKSKEAAFWSALQSPLSKLSASHTGAHTEYWLRNTPPQVADIIFDVADATLPAEQLYTYAAAEGLVDVYVRPQISGLSATAAPTKAQLAGVRTDRSVSGFTALGLDDFMTDMAAKREPLTGHLPPGYDPSKATEIRRTNEQGREVRSARFDDLKTALQAMSAMLKRRRTLFKQDAKANGYATPTEEELVYWTYLYYNAGEFGGKAQLEKYKGKRKLSDWITRGEYPNSIKILKSFRMLKAMKLF